MYFLQKNMKKSFENFCEELSLRADKEECLHHQRASIKDFTEFVKREYELNYIIWDDSDKIYEKTIGIVDVLRKIDPPKRITMNIFINKYLKNSDEPNLKSEWNDEQVTYTADLVVEAFTNCPGEQGDSRMGSSDEEYSEEEVNGIVMYGESEDEDFVVDQDETRCRG